MLLVFCVLYLLGLATAVTLPNHPLKFDTNGSLLDAHDGKIYHFDGRYYLYGVSYNCGFRWRTSNYESPFCGFKVYSSTDLLTWEDQGFLFDAQTQYWQDLCADTAACFRPKVLQNPDNGTYILWMNSGSTEFSYTVMTSENPTGPFEEVGKPTMPLARAEGESYGNGDFGIHIGPNGEGVMAYDVTPYVTGPPLFSSPNITYGIVQRLTPNYTATESEYTVTDLTNVEAFDIWYRKGWWYMTFGHICGYCDSTDTSYIKAKSPLGPFREADRVRISNSSCGGQHNAIAKLPANNAHIERTGDEHVYLHSSDLWTGEVNEGKAGQHWEPLEFADDGEILPLKCYEPTYEVEIVTEPSDADDVVSNAAVSSHPSNFTYTCGFGKQDRNWLYQFFQAPKSGNVSEMGINVAQEHNDGNMQLYLGEVVNVSMLYTPEGGVDNLWDGEYNVSDIGWSMPMIKAYPNVTIEEGKYYAIYMTARATMVPYCYLERETGNGALSNGFDTGVLDNPPRSFLSAIQQGRYPLFPLLGKEMRYYVQID